MKPKTKRNIKKRHNAAHNSGRQVDSINTSLLDRFRTVSYNVKKFFRISIKSIKELLNYRVMGYVLLGVVALIIVMIIMSVSSCNKQAEKASATIGTTSTVSAVPESYKISGVPVITQDVLKAGCETYACIMLLQYWGFDINEFDFVDNYLITRPVYYGYGGELYGPDMNSAYAGDIYTGYGINAPAMAKCMNNYIKETKSELKAYPLSEVPLETLCKEYILDNKPVMCWETTYMDEPYIKASWKVDYVDENAKFEIGDTVSWMQNEHCMVLVGYDKDNYYFCDSVAGKLASYDKKTAEERYSQIGMQAIVIK